MKLVKIEWVDSAHAANPWIGKDRTVTPAECKTVGWVIHDTKKFVTLAMSVAPEQFGHAMTIPRGCITKITKL